MSAREEILEYIRTLEIIDTHEHLPEEAAWARRDTDVLTDWLWHYFSCDLVSAGLSRNDLKGAVLDPGRPLAERWRLVEPYWNAARNTGYARALDITARDIYGLPGVTGETIEELDRRFRKARQEAAAGASHYEFVLKKKSRIAVSLLDGFDGRRERDGRFFRNVWRADEYLNPTHTGQVEETADRLGMRIHTLADWKEALERDMDDALAKGAVALKSGAAYWRPISYVKAATEAAEHAWNSLWNVPKGPDWEGIHWQASRAFQDHMMHHVMALADRRGLPFQIHTGLQEGNGNIVANSNPELLSNLFLEYRNVTFDVFHMGYPYQHALSALAKNFPNVMIDMCWAHIISPEAAVRALVEFLDAVPANKISAFGGDYIPIDPVYGHQYIARENVARALAIKVADGCFDADRAKEIARWVFVDNPRRIFKL